MPFVFTEHGTVMLANILRSDMAIKASIEVVRAFVRLRELSLNYQDLTNKINKMEQKYDTQFRFVFDAIRELMKPPSSKNRRIGFVNDKS
jgi:dimeric dUTPase (all-alpha-NTP-PPase superfamily)